MAGDLVLLIGLTLIARIAPRAMVPYAVSSDAYYHLLAADRIRENRFRLPARLRGLFFPGPYDYPPLFHYMLALVPRRATALAERFVSPVIDAAYAALVYGFLVWLLEHDGVPAGDAAQRALWLSLAFVVSPALLYAGRGPRAYNANPRILSEALFAAAMAAAVVWFVSDSMWAFAAAVVFVALLLLASKFGAQVVAFFFPPMAALLGSAGLLAIGVLGFVLAVVGTRGHYLRVLKGHVGHLALFARVGARKDSPMPWKSEWREFFQLLRRKPDTTTLYRLLLINSVSCFVVRNPQLVLLAVVWWRGPAWGNAGPLLWGWTALSIGVFVVVSVRRMLFLGEAERYVSYSVPAHFALLAIGWSHIPPVLWAAFVVYSVALSAVYQVAFVRVSRHSPDLRSESAKLHDFLRSQGRTLRIVPIAESPHKLAYRSGHEVFYPCGNFQIWYTPVEEYLRIYGPFMQPRIETLAETAARYGIDTVLVNRRGDPNDFCRRMDGSAVLFENDTFVLYDLRTAGRRLASTETVTKDAPVR